MVREMMIMMLTVTSYFDTFLISNRRSDAVSFKKIGPAGNPKRRILLLQPVGLF